MRLALLALLGALPAIASSASNLEMSAAPDLTAAAAGVRRSRQSQPTVSEAWLAVTLNGQSTDRIVLVLRQVDGHIRVRDDDLQSWHITLPRTAEAIERDGARYILLDSIPGLKYQVDEPGQVLLLEAAAKTFEPARLSGSMGLRSPPTPPPPGGFLNYDLAATRYQGQTSGSLLLEGNLFVASGAAVSRVLSTELPDGQRSSVRLETTFTHDDPEHLTSLRIGDSITGPSRLWGGAVRFGGIQWGTNFATRPDLVTLPLPNMTGEAALPSTVDLYVNGILRLRRDVPMGPFSIQDVPILTGAGDVQLVVRDIQGRQQVITQSYYASSDLLRPGLQDYSYEIGFARNGFGTASNEYGRALLTGTHRAGLSDRLTGEIHGEILQDHQSLGVGGSMLLPWGGVLSAAVAGSHGRAGEGELVSLALSRTGHRFGFGTNVQRASSRFTYLGLLPGQPAPRLLGQAFAQVSIPPIGSAGLSYTRQDFRDRPAVRLVTLQENSALGAVGFLTVSLVRVLGNQPDRILTVNVTRALGVFTSASAGMTSSTPGTTNAHFMLQKSLPMGEGYGYRLAADGVNGDYRQAAMAYQNAIGTYGLEADSVHGDTGVQVTASGSVALLGEHVFASRRIDGSFAVAEVPEHPGVHVYSDNQLIGQTDARGLVLIPQLRPYQDNRIRIEQADLPLEVEIASDQVTAVPYFRSGLMLKFPVSSPAGALVSVVLDNGEPLPAGATVTLLGPATGEEQPFPTGLNGEAYLTGLTAHNRLRVTWRGQTCEILMSYTRTDDPLPRLGPYTCHGVRP